MILKMAEPGEKAKHLGSHLRQEVETYCGKGCVRVWRIFPHPEINDLAGIVQDLLRLAHGTTITATARRGRFRRSLPWAAPDSRVMFQTARRSDQPATGITSTACVLFWLPEIRMVPLIGATSA